MYARIYPIFAERARILGRFEITTNKRGKKRETIDRYIYLQESIG